MSKCCWSRISDGGTTDISLSFDIGKIYFVNTEGRKAFDLMA
jgi:hypothetical protein